MPLFRRYCIIDNRFNKGSGRVARKYFRKFKRLKKESQSSELVLTIRAMLQNRKVRMILAVVLVVAVVLGIYLYNIYHKYDGYKVKDSIKIDSGESSKYVAFGDFVVRYSGDGISYIDGEETVWDEAFEMKAPLIDVCGDYLAISDKNTNDILLYDDDGRQGTVTTNYPIIKLEVAKQGVVAALLEDKNANYIEVYDKEGNQLVSHKTIVDQNGYPVTFSLSDDGTKMMVSYLTVESGAISNKVLFYNFSNAGKNSDERMVGGFDHYKEIIVPTVQFVSNDDAIAVGENVLSIYKMNKKPDLKEEVTFKDEVHKVFYNEEYVGLVFKNTNSQNPYRIEVYNLNGNRVMNTEISMDFNNFKFSGKNVVMYNDLNCQIISLKGVKKFEYTFKEGIKEIIPIDGSRTYLFMMNSSIEKIRLK